MSIYNLYYILFIRMIANNMKRCTIHGTKLLEFWTLSIKQLMREIEETWFQSFVILGQFPTEVL